MPDPGVETIGRITITYDMDADGEMTTTVDADELPLIILLGMLRLAEDTVIRTAMDED